MICWDILKQVFFTFRSSRPEVFCKKAVVRNFTKVTGKHLAREVCNFIKKESLAQVFFCEFCKISQNTFFYRTPLSTCFCPMRSNSPLSVGFINKGNTCYANAILQAQSVLISLRNRVPWESSSLSPLLKSATLNMKIKSRSKKQLIHPVFYGPSLARSQESRHASFNFNS